MDDLQKAIQVLKKGGIVIFPTDTAFGIGCRMDDGKAIKRLFSLRKRPRTLAVPVLVDSIAMAKRYFKTPLPYDVRHLMEKHWPGGLTIVYPCKTDKVFSAVRGGGATLGVRMPNHKVPLALIQAIGVPLLAPSANFHGEKTPVSFKELNKRLIKLADFVIEDKCLSGKASTVVDCSVKPWQVLRQGVVDLDLL